MAGKVTIVLDAQAGSCGKGKVVGYLAQKNHYDMSINNFMSNAGHTYVDDDGNKMVTQQLPTSLVSWCTTLYIGAEAAITPSILFGEILKYKYKIGQHRTIIINPNAVVIKAKHRKQEEDILRSGSTFKGCGAARADKIMRQAELFGSWWHRFIVGETTQGEMGTDRIYSEDEMDILQQYIAVQDMTHYANYLYDNDKTIIVEGSQGCDLDINFGLGYPHVTSRQCHAGQLLADAGLSPRIVSDIYMIMRPYPIRISNTTNLKDGDGTLVASSGDYGDSNEITWEEVRKRCGAPDNIEFGEQTTVTKKTRRVFEMNWERLKYVTQLNRPTGIVLNFAQYLDWNVAHATQQTKERVLQSKAVMDFVHMVEFETGVPVVMIGTGERNCEMVELV